MAALLPILQEILPMLMPGSVHITKAEELQGPPPDAFDVEDEDEDDGVVSGDEAAADGDDEDEPGLEEAEGDASRGDGETADKPEAEATRTRSRGIDDDGGEDDNNGDGESGGADDKERTAPLLLRPGPQEQAQPKRPPRPHVRRLPHNGVSLRDAIVHKSGSLCASVLTVKPGCSTVVFHNGEQEAIVYAASGTAVLATLPEDFDEYGDESFADDGASTSSHARKGPEPATTTISAGDFVFIPAWTEHQVRNEGVTDESGKPADDVVWVVTRNAGEPTVVPLQGWGCEQAE
ncbi:hypothetical protein SEUCBS139899_008953 [Sporothrix eucalyptigena]|uniref:Cupin 2 conserved barrel domain-containing protein n=1 Tax=Sporothrix eucalyptigena TaxID=1812306 RepID=A0ABP0C0C3_9PEZI